MAKPRETTAPDPPVDSEEEEEEESGDKEEEEASEEENQGSESELEGPANAKKSSSSQAPASKKQESQTGKPQNPAPTAASSSEDEESGFETDTDSPPKKPDPSIKPIASKPMSEPEKTTTTKKPRSKPNAGPSYPTRPATRAGTKRPAPVATTPSADADAKRSKRKLAESFEKKGAPSDEGKKLFARVWSEDDEIAILRGIIDYSAKKMADPLADLNAFHEFIKNKINIDVSRTQLQDKIRRLKKKYVNNAGKEKNGKERTFSNPHEQKAYDLSKKIWGNKKNVGEETPEVPKADGTAARKNRNKGSVGTTQKIEGAEEEVKEEKSLASGTHKSVSFLPDGRPIEEWVLYEGMKLLDEDDRFDMEKKWKQLRIEEAGLLVKRYEFAHGLAQKFYGSLISKRD